MVSEIEELLENKESAEDKIAEFNLACGKAYTFRDFLRYHTAVDQEDFVREAFSPFPSKFRDIPDEQFIEIITAICNAEFAPAEHTYWLNFLSVNLECDVMSNLIYWNSEKDASPERILEQAKAWQRQVIITSPPQVN